MSAARRIFPGKLAGALCTVLALVLTAVLFACALSGVAVRLLTDERLLSGVVTDGAVVAAQYEAIGEAVDALSAEYPFEPATVMRLVTPARVSGYGVHAAAWLTGLTGAEPTLRLDDFTVEGLEDAIRADETFLAGTPSAQRKTVARDKIAAEVERIVTRTVVPVRTALITLGMSEVLKRADVAGLMSYAMYAPAALGLLALCLVLLMALCCLRWPGRALAFGGAAAIAAGLLTAGVTVLAVCLDLTGQVSALNATLGLECRLLLEHLAWQAGLTAGGLVLLGLILTCVHQHLARVREEDAAKRLAAQAA